MLKIQHLWLLFAFCMGATSCSLSSAIRTPRPTQPHKVPAAKKDPNKVRVVVFSHGWHTGIVIPGKEMRRHGWTEDLLIADTAQVEFGWGAEEFYRKPDLTVPMVIRGLFWPTAAVVHVERIHGPIYQHYPHSQLVTLDLTRPQVDTMISSLSVSLQRSQQTGRLLNLGPGIEQDSSFFRSRTRYYYPRTCNVWTSKLLRAAGLDIPLVTRSPLLMRRLRELPEAVD